MVNYHRQAIDRNTIQYTSRHCKAPNRTKSQRLFAGRSIRHGREHPLGQYGKPEPGYFEEEESRFFKAPRLAIAFPGADLPP